jgi:hypothetical protein
VPRNPDEVRAAGYVVSGDAISTEPENGVAALMNISTTLDRIDGARKLAVFTTIPAAPGLSFAKWTLYYSKNDPKRTLHGQFDYLPIIAWCVRTQPHEDDDSGMDSPDITSYPVTIFGGVASRYSGDADLCYIVEHGDGEDDEPTFFTLWGKRIGNTYEATEHAKSDQAKIDAIEKQTEMRDKEAASIDELM